MKRPFLTILVAAVGACAIGASGTELSPPSIARTSAHHMLSSGGNVVSLDPASGSAADDSAVDDDATRAAVRQQLRANQAGTYIGEMLAERDSSLARWPDRRGQPLRVWVQSFSHVSDWSPNYADSVRSAFIAWNEVDLPVSFRFVNDSASANVHVTWIDRFDEPISGRTKWARDDNWWITDGDIVLAVHHHGGEVLEEDAMKAMALHEIGHLIGLDHTSDQGSIMAARVRIRDLAREDLATARLLYTLPAGAVR